MENQLELSFTSYHANSYIVIEGKQNTGFFYIIRDGKVRVFKEDAGGDKSEILGPGDFIGVIPAMSFQNHLETAVALTDVVVIKVHQQQYIELIQKNPSVAVKIIKQFSQKLRLLNSALAEFTLVNSTQEGPPHLFNVAEHYFNQKQYGLAFYAYAKYYKYCQQGDKIPIVKDKLAKLSNLASHIQLEFGPDQTNRIYKKNTMLFAEGEPGNELFIIQKGSVKICKVAGNNESLLAVLKEGDIFGEMALLEGKPRIASAVAYEDCKVITVNKENFELIIKSQPQLIAKVTSLLADRIWLIYKKLENVLINDPMGRIYNTIYIQLEKNRVPLSGANMKTSYTFNFGWQELFGMSGLPAEQNKPLHLKISNNQKIQITENQINIISIMEIIRQTDYYRKMEKRDKLRPNRG